jgi:hypothetical protein
MAVQSWAHQRVKALQALLLDSGSIEGEAGALHKARALQAKAQQSKALQKWALQQA